MHMCPAELHNHARATPYFGDMRRSRQHETRAVLAKNLRILMERRDWTQTALKEKSGVSQRHISSLLNQQQDCTTEILAGLALAFRLPGWLLLVADLPAELLDSQDIPLLIQRYLKAGPEGRSLLNIMAERESHHNIERSTVVPIGSAKRA